MGVRRYAAGAGHFADRLNQCRTLGLLERTRRCEQQERLRRRWAVRLEPPAGGRNLVAAQQAGTAFAAEDEDVRARPSGARQDTRMSAPIAGGIANLSNGTSVPSRMTASFSSGSAAGLGDAAQPGVYDAQVPRRLRIVERLCIQDFSQPPGLEVAGACAVRVAFCRRIPKCDSATMRSR